ncbi:MAG: hypothetical protein AB1330_01020 [Bacillota bacterium]
MDWFFAALTFTATLLAIHKRWYAFLIFACTNVWWIVYDIGKEAYAQAALFGAYFLLNTYGLRKWYGESKVSGTER